MDASHAAARALLRRRVEAGHWEGHLASSALATATAVTALACGERAGLRAPDGQRLVAGGLDWLTATQNADGGWGDTPHSVSNISTTALVWAALSFGTGAHLREAADAAAAWLTRAAGGPEPKLLAAALAQRYGKDRTFSVPILTMCAIAGRLGPPERAWSLIPQLPFELATLPRRFFGALRLPVVSYALPALISMGLARHRSGARIPGISWIRELAAGRVLRALEGLQPRNGGFLEAVPLTSFVAMSLVAAGERDHPAVTKGIGFLSRSVRPDGSWPIDTNLATWVTTLATNALAAGPAWGEVSQRDRDRVRDWLLAQQWRVEHPYTGAAPGGWAWTDLPGGVPDADDTAGALLALAHLAPNDERARAAAAQGVTWLVDLQNADGGIPTFCRGWGTLPFDRSATDLTAHAIRAWTVWAPRLDSAIRVRVERAIDRAFLYLAREQRGDGSFVPLWFGNQAEAQEENPVFGTSRVLKGLCAAPSDTAARVASISARARQYLVSVQNPDGGWGASAGVPSSIEETAVAVAALRAATAGSADVSPAIDRGVKRLVELTGGLTTFDAAPIGLYFARLWYSEDLYPLIFTVDALGGRVDAAHERIRT